MARAKKSKDTAVRAVAGEDTTVELEVGHWTVGEEEREFKTETTLVLTISNARELELSLPTAIGESLTAAHSLANAGEVPPLSEPSQSPQDAEAAAAEAAEGAQPAEPEPEEDE